MKAQHTSGPWRVQGPHDAPWVQNDANVIVPNTLADARLIAAAPEMAARLRESQDALDRAGCQFAYCEGPDVPPIDMRTCFRCGAMWHNRALLARIDGE